VGFHKQIEANERVGGHSPFSQGLYMDAGAMRIPDFHFLTLEYMHKLGLPINPFINETPNDLIHVNSILTRLKSYNQRPDILTIQYPHMKKAKPLWS
jgi:monoamine oxidase